MIPHKLQIKNFLSYGPDIQTIDFSHHQLICLSGKNGHGKSALLDAITWVLWGQARKTIGSAQAAQGLLHLGQTQMLVVFDFSFNGQCYRVRREYMQSYGKPISSLEFGLLDSTINTIIPLTEKTIRMTQQKIERTLRLDFETFINSAFLRQGNSNEFSKKSPKDRKKILAAILGLDQYDIIRKLATDKMKQATIKKQVLITLQDKFDKELETIPHVQKQMQKINQQLDDCKKQEKNLEKKKIDIIKKQKKFNVKKKSQEVVIFKLEQIEQEETKQQDTLKTLFFSWRKINYKKHHVGLISRLNARKIALIKEIETHQQQLQDNLKVKEQFLKIKEKKQELQQKHTKQLAHFAQQGQLQLERYRIEQQITKKKIGELQIEYDQCREKKREIQEALKILNNQQIMDHNNQKILLNQEKKFTKRKEYYQYFVAFGNVIQKELNNLEQKKRFTQTNNDPSCPLCEQNLSTSRRRFLKKKITLKERFMKHRLKRLHTIIPNLKAILIEQNKLITTYKKQHEEQAIHKLKIAELTKNKKELTVLCDQLSNHIIQQKKNKEELEKKISKQKMHITEQETSFNTTLKEGKIYQRLVKQIKVLEQKFINNNYDSNHHKKSQEQLYRIEQKLVEHNSIHEELNKQDQRKKDIDKLCISLKKIKLVKNDYKKEITLYKNLPQQRNNIDEQETILNNEYKKLSTKKECLLKEKGGFETLQQKLNQIEREYKEQQKMIISLTNTIDDYQTIAIAAGNDGIQALLIDETIPEIEQEANRLLSKLTNNQAHIIFDSLRDLKKGGTKETLDIKISDSTGIRPYELFSGGEAFRIDFALRIAISKLLARRSGTALQTLIIDEGFGSQDEEGLGHIMDALYKIQNDFSKIIVVSHLTTLKDKFPVHFLIEKNHYGSNVRIMELG